MPKKYRIRDVLREWGQIGLKMMLLLGMGLLLGIPCALCQENPPKGAGSMPKIALDPIGRVERRNSKIFVTVQPEFAEALDGIEGYSQIWVIYWFHGNDTPEKRRTLKVHPRRDPANPLTGVFATRSPARPNLLGLQACRLVSREGNRLEVAGLDAWDGSPVLDIKPYLPPLDAYPQATMPKWAEGKPPE